MDMQMKGNWDQLKGLIQKKWGKLTSDDLDVIHGDRKMLVGRLEERYGYTEQQAEQEVRNFLSSSDMGDMSGTHHTF